MSSIDLRLVRKRIADRRAAVIGAQSFFSTYEEVLTMVRAVLDGEGPLEYLLVAEELADEIDRHRLGLLVDEVGGESW